MKKVPMIMALALVLCMVGGAVAEDISANSGKKNGSDRKGFGIR